MTIFTDTTGTWNSLADDETRAAMNDFLTQYTPSDVVTLTSIKDLGTSVVWHGDLNGRKFTMHQDFNYSDITLHDVWHDTHGNKSF
jgi:hypothetical protein